MNRPRKAPIKPLVSKDGSQSYIRGNTTAAQKKTAQTALKSNARMNLKSVADFIGVGKGVLAAHEATTVNARASIKRKAAARKVNTTRAKSKNQ